MTANVPTIDSGTARLGMIVAERLRRNRKITSTTRRDGEQQRELHVVDRLADGHRAVVDDVEADRRPAAAGGTTGSSLRMASTTSMVLVPGWRCTASTTARSSLNQLATLSVCTPSMTRPSSSSRTGEPLR